MPHRSKHTAKRVATINTKIADFVSYRTDPYYFSSPEGAELSAIHIEVQRSIEAATDEMTFEMDPLLMKQAEEVLQQRAGRLYLYWLAVSTDKAKAWNEIIEEFDDLIVGPIEICPPHVDFDVRQHKHLPVFVNRAFCDLIDHAHALGSGLAVLANIFDVAPG